MGLLIAANWKMNTSQDQATRLIHAVKAYEGKGHVDIALLVPYVHIPMCSELLSAADLSVSYGAQDVSYHSNGAFTGAISVEMLADYGCSYVIIGHSERRHVFGESDDECAKKFARVVQNNGAMCPILCVGETWEDRERGESKTVVSRQLEAYLSVIDSDSAPDRLIIAYEPVWAIGTGKVACVDDVREMHQHILGQVSACSCAFNTVRVLYGGSVKPENVAQFTTLDEVGGFLVGGASLSSQTFTEILELCITSLS